MEIRKTDAREIAVLMQIFEQARHFMRNSGNPDQWIDGYPSIEIIIKDITDGNSYVCIDGSGEIAGTFSFARGNEPAYSKIYEGQWLNDKPYGVIHRLAGKTGSIGIADACLQWCSKKCENIRTDTHRDNFIMRKILENRGFTQCGIIYVANGTQRLAFQKTENG
ncbi:MAG: GNAT family N-acetyltransferase [Prevotellaceae bacterium]|jgi:RimJ/RimL family protein N-acetyltransferase|nr:GNAT family N-acetyltransferase [Prevotellaceae bacterium]